MRLSVVLGIDVDTILDWPHDKVLLYLAYSEIEPLPDPWLQTGMMCAVSASPWSKKPVTPEDFMPQVRRSKEINPTAVIERFRLFAGRGKGMSFEDRRERT